MFVNCEITKYEIKKAKIKYMAKKEFKTDSQSDFVNINNSNRSKQTTQIRATASPNSVGSQILVQLKQNEKISQEIYKSVKFIKRYYLWSVISSLLKIFILIAIIVLGVTSWRNILDHLTNNLSNIFSEQLTAFPEQLIRKPLE